MHVSYNKIGTVGVNSNYLLALFDLKYVRTNKEMDWEMTDGQVLLSTLYIHMCT